jgi:hypothetical protein
LSYSEPFWFNARIMQNLVPTRRIVPDFTPVPRKCRRYDGWTAERQRAFIDALAELGSVKAAAARVNMAQEGAYALRRADHADGFRAAWDAALAHGVQRLTDIAIDRAIEGVAVPIFHKGEQVGEKRWYNDRLLMFLLKHHLPGKYGTAALPRGTRHPDTVAREAAENCPVCKQRAEDEAADTPAEHDRWLADMLDRYQAKVRAERHYRMTGQTIAADFIIRQLTHMELVLDIGGRTQQMLEEWTYGPNKWGNDPQPINASPISNLLDLRRRAAWREAGEPARPRLRLDRTLPQTHIMGSPNIEERQNARRACEARMAEAQKEWEAAAREDTWEEWLRSKDGGGCGSEPG